jgi:hypothetical protein
MPKAPKTKKDTHEPTEAEWWYAKKLGLHPHEILDTLVRQLEEDQESRYNAYREYARLFGAEPDMFGNDDTFSVLHTGVVSQNELGNTIETLHAQVFKNRIVPGVACNEADYEEWTRARALSRWIEGVQDTAELHYDACPRAGLDMFVYGTGFIKIGHDEDSDGFCTIRYHRVDPRFVLTDRLEARCGKPRNLYEKDFVDMYQLAEEYGEEDDSYYGTAAERVAGILGCKPNDDVDMALGSRLKTTMLTIREAWHLPSKKGKKDGRHVIWVKGCTLVDETWSWNRFPFTIMRFGHRLNGFYGKSAVQVLAPTQRNFDKLNAKIDEAQDIMGIPRIILQRNANLTRTHLDDIPGGVLEVDVPGAIQEWNATAMSPEIYNERASCPDKMRSLLGVNQFDTQNQLPPAMREVSGPALERLLDSGTARHAMTHAQLEWAMMDLAYMSMDYAADLVEDGKEITVVSPGSSKTSVELLSFSDVQVDRKRMKLKVLPTNQMPQTFAGKVEQFQKLYQDQAIDKQTYLRMLEVPDVGGATDFLGSDEEIILKNLHWMVKKGKFIPPLQYDNLDLIVPLTTAFINWYRIREDADMETVGLLAQYIEAAIALKEGLGSQDPNAPPAIDPETGLPTNPMEAPPVDAATGLPQPGLPPEGVPPPPGTPGMDGMVAPEGMMPEMAPPMM